MQQLTTRAPRSVDADRLLTLWLLLRGADVSVDVRRLDSVTVRSAALGAIRELTTVLVPGVGDATPEVTDFLATDLGGIATP